MLTCRIEYLSFAFREVSLCTHVLHVQRLATELQELPPFGFDVPSASSVDCVISLIKGANSVIYIAQICWLLAKASQARPIDPVELVSFSTTQHISAFKENYNAFQYYQVSVIYNPRPRTMNLTPSMAPFLLHNVLWVLCFSCPCAFATRGCTDVLSHARVLLSPEVAQVAIVVLHPYIIILDCWIRRHMDAHINWCSHQPSSLGLVSVAGVFMKLRHEKAFSCR